MSLPISHKTTADTLQVPAAGETPTNPCNTTPENCIRFECERAGRCVEATQTKEQPQDAIAEIEQRFMSYQRALALGHDVGDPEYHFAATAFKHWPTIRAALSAPQGVVPLMLDLRTKFMGALTYLNGVRGGIEQKRMSEQRAREGVKLIDDWLAASKDAPR